MSKEINNANFNDRDFFTYNIKNNKVTSGGYEINSTLLKKQVPLIGMNKLNGLAIPVGLLHLSQNNEKEPLEEIYDETPLQEDIYDKLLKLMNEPDKKPEKINKKNKTRKPIKTPSRFTKKNKKIKINRNK
tara:strand:- start:1736 stop:2128 length:393 start_codon:yes stop_codon:yes gene_type:complete